MELLTVVDDFFVTASLALLLTFIVLKLVEVINDTHAIPKRHVVHREPDRPVSHAEQRFTVQPAPAKTKVGFVSPVQEEFATCAVGTEHKIEKKAAVKPVRPRGKRFTVHPAQSKSGVETECNREEIAVEPERKIEEAVVEPVPVQTEVTVGLISPVQDDTCVGTAEKIEEATTVESDKNVEEEIAEGNEGTQELDDSAEKRNVKSVEEISVEPSTEIEASVTDSGVKENFDDDDDDWEGIERSELEKEFMAATKFVSGEENRLGGAGSNLRMELYGLHKVATEGPCREPQPMALKLAARAKWNAWQKLGNMNPEVAMEQYVSLLSDKFPGWMKDTSAGIGEHETTRPEVSESAASDLSTTLSNQQQMITTERELEQESDSKDRSPLTVSDLENSVRF
ncbi:Acyl-CoA-binding domain-containing protein 3 isoform A [Glycine soja]|uniref:Acyl-CoA-binding domain-containing protein 3 isoform A n=1 Tax=Glycine soja TaxID=3848 RepID=A0A445H409_GLYSO|nr:Acyl-CoA-binding domain-containing protein 3 isoform A [Glycine soja]